MSLYKAIKALEALRDSDGTLVLNHDQASYLFYLLWDVFETGAKDLEFASLDLLGVISDEKERAV
jgi:hypothetical protein